MRKLKIEENENLILSHEYREVQNLFYKSKDLLNQLFLVIIVTIHKGL